MNGSYGTSWRWYANRKNFIFFLDNSYSTGYITNITTNREVNMKNIEIGDLVRIVSEWRGHNPWMKFPDEQPIIGLITGISHNITAYRVLTEGREILLPPTRVEALCK